MGHIAECLQYRGVLISGEPFKRGSTVAPQPSENTPVSRSTHPRLHVEDISVRYDTGTGLIAAEDHRLMVVHQRKGEVHTGRRAGACGFGRGPCTWDGRGGEGRGGEPYITISE